MDLPPPAAAWSSAASEARRRLNAPDAGAPAHLTRLLRAAASSRSERHREQLPPPAAPWPAPRRPQATRACQLKSRAELVDHPESGVVRETRRAIKAARLGARAVAYGMPAAATPRTRRRPRRYSAFWRNRRHRFTASAGTAVLSSPAARRRTPSRGQLVRHRSTAVPPTAVRPATSERAECSTARVAAHEIVLRAGENVTLRKPGDSHFEIRK